MEPDVAGSLTELERKLKELEQELEAVGRGAQPVAPHSVPPAAGEAGLSYTAQWRGQDTPPPAGGPGPGPAAPPAIAAAPEPPASAGVAVQLDELLRLREQLARTADELVAEVTRVVQALGADATAPVVGGHEVDLASAPAVYPLHAAPPAPPVDPAATILAGRVTIEAAPFDDIAMLGSFEQALARTAGVLEVYVRALDRGRATVDVELSGPVALGAELRRTSPVAFRVVDVGQGRIELALDGGT